MFASLVFLSYSHKDNVESGPKRMRWIETFEGALRESLDRRLGPDKVQLWLDKRGLLGSQAFDPEIRSQLGQAIAMVSVLSNFYIASDYCRFEFQFYGTDRVARNDLHVGTLSRILKVYRIPIERARLVQFATSPCECTDDAPSHLQDSQKLSALGKEVDSNTGYHLYFKDELDRDSDILLDPDARLPMYWQHAEDIAVNIQALLPKSGEAAGSRQTADAGKGSAPAGGRLDGRETPVVFLARCAGDVLPYRDALQREFIDRGYVVLPSDEYPDDAAGFEAAVLDDLKRAQLSLHIVGSRFGSTPDGGGERSGVVIQADAALSQSPLSLSTLFWSPPQLDRDAIKDASQNRFLAKLDNLPMHALRAEYVRVPLEQLKTLVFERLEGTWRRNAPPDAPSGGLYLVCDGVDREVARSLRAALVAHGMEVAMPSLEGTVQELLEENRAYMIECDALLVLWAGTREAWVRSKLRDAAQAPGWGKTRPYRAKIVVMAPPDSLAKRDFDPPAGTIIVRPEGLITHLATLSP
jgi:hypothetical protein